MKIITFVLFGIGMSHQLGMAEPQKQPKPQSHESEDYELGSALGSCLAVKCQVFRGAILSDSPKSGEPIMISVEEGLIGVPGDTKTISIPFEIAHGAGDNGSLINAVWARAKISKSSAVTVVLALEKVSGFPGLQALVTSGERDTGIIRTLVAEEQRLQDSPDQVYSLLASLSGTPNPAMAGFLRPHVTGSRKLSIEQKSSLFLELFPSLKGDDLGFFSSLVVSYNYPHLPPSSQVAMIQRLAELAQQPDPELSMAALRGLIQIGKYDHSALMTIPAASLAGLESLYRASVQKKSIPREPSFEAELGTKAQ
jgi:hypothetical protein